MTVLLLTGFLFLFIVALVIVRVRHEMWDHWAKRKMEDQSKAPMDDAE